MKKSVHLVQMRILNIIQIAVSVVFIQFIKSCNIAIFISNDLTNILRLFIYKSTTNNSRYRVI